MDQVIRGTIFQPKGEKPIFLYDDIQSRRMVAARMEELNADETAEVFKNIIKDGKQVEDFSGSTNDDR